MNRAEKIIEAITLISKHESLDNVVELNIKIIDDDTIEVEATEIDTIEG